MQEAKKMQDNIEKKMKEFNESDFEFNYKSSIITKIKGSFEVVSIDINKDLIDPDDKTMLEEMIAEAINIAIIDISKKKNEITKLSPNMPF